MCTTILPPNEDVPRLRRFAPLTETETRRLVSSLQIKSCDIDPIAAKVFQLLQDELIPIYMRIINLSLGQGEFAQDWKNSSVKPLLKKTGLDLIRKNYQPVSNLMYISKMVEKAVLNQFNAHSDNHDLLPNFQSAYREGYSIETALLKLVNDALWLMENKQILVVAIMDFSATFDMVDHDLLLSVLHNSFGISDTALSWYETYLRPHTMTVKVNNSSSKMTNLKYGVPQGSCSGANIFTAYSSLIKNMVDDTFTLNGFADDHSICRDYVAGNINEMKNLKKDLEKNLDSIGHWMDQMRLKLNPDKTELISFGGRAQCKKGIITSIEVGDATVNASTDVKYLGAHLDQTLDFKKQVMMKT